MSIQANKLMTLADGQVLYDDLRDRIGNIAPEDDLVATAAHAVDDVIMVGKQLYRVTAAIAIGDTITSGTNVTPKTIAELIEPLIALTSATGVGF